MRQAGAISAGCAALHPVDPLDAETFAKWLDKGHNAGMGYMANHRQLRLDPSGLLLESRSIISLAFGYAPRQQRSAELQQIAQFAYGADYHDVLRRRLETSVESLKIAFGGDYRICIDSAPLLERYWAEKCGVGSRCDNGLIAVPRYGTRILLAEILTSLPLHILSAGTERAGDLSDPASGNASESGKCTHCGACRRACPAGALQPDSTVDARRCLSYLTIEHRGEWDETGVEAMRSEAGRNTLFGCDICQRVCPLNRYNPPSEIIEFNPSDRILALSAADVAAMSQEGFSRTFKGSPIKRSKLAGLMRNALNSIEDP